MTLDDQLGGPFDTVLDIGGNVGDFAELAVKLWPDANVISFEPVPHLADLNRARAAGRWRVETVALSLRDERTEMRYCVNQPSASTLERPGNVRNALFNLRDVYDTIMVDTEPLDFYLLGAVGRLLVKVDAEGHEGAVLAGGRKVLEKTATVICEVQNDPAVYQGSTPVAVVTRLLADAGLLFAGVLDVLHAPDGHVVQFDGIWQRPGR